ncbi:MAG: DUF1028 domain-containing protein [Alphaproteobacteria bacterium]|nr:DUF1028 domain-containing protein [Alphaproteobacteria bacterium]
MTWSIVARDPASGAFGVAVATRFLAAGGLCPHAESGVGALSTQAMINPTYGARGLALLRSGASAREAVEALIAADAGRATRQVHVVDRYGGSLAHTGSECIEWSGHHCGDGVSVAGNMLAGPAVVGNTFDRYVATTSLPFAERLIEAMTAGQAAGGDKRGQQSACILIYGTEDYPDLSLRVDDHPTAVAELRRIYGLWLGRFAAHRKYMATRADPVGVYDRRVIEAEVERREALLES